MLVDRLIGESGAALNAAERKQIVLDIQNEILGLGPIEPLLADPTVSDILVNTLHDRSTSSAAGRLRAHAASTSTATST